MTGGEGAFLIGHATPAVRVAFKVGCVQHRLGGVQTCAIEGCGASVTSACAGIWEGARANASGCMKGACVCLWTMWTLMGVKE